MRPSPPLLVHSTGQHELWEIRHNGGLPPSHRHPVSESTHISLGLQMPILRSHGHLPPVVNRCVQRAKMAVQSRVLTAICERFSEILHPRPSCQWIRWVDMNSITNSACPNLSRGSFARMPLTIHGLSHSIVIPVSRVISSDMAIVSERCQ
jgi:hypothetical protein